MSNVYDQPEDFDLKTVGEIDYYGGGYGFDWRVVWRHKGSGKLYTARDAGCSCPSPFEDYTKLEDLDELVDMAALREEVRAGGRESGNDYGIVSPVEAQDFLERVARALRRSKEKNR